MVTQSACPRGVEQGLPCLVLVEVTSADQPTDSVRRTVQDIVSVALGGSCEVGAFLLHGFQGVFLLYTQPSGQQRGGGVTGMCCGTGCRFRNWHRERGGDVVQVVPLSGDVEDAGQERHIGVFQVQEPWTAHHAIQSGAVVFLCADHTGDCFLLVVPLVVTE